LIMHGASFAAMKIEDPVSTRARRIAKVAAVSTLIVFAGCGAWLLKMDGHVIQNLVAGNAPSNPLHKQVALVSGAWLENHGRNPWTLLFPSLAALALLAVPVLRRAAHAFVASSVAVAMIVFTAGFALFPFLLPSSTDPSHGLTVWDASSSQLTLGIMLFATVVLLPIVLAYSTWAFRVMRGQVTRSHIAESEEVY